METAKYFAGESDLNITSYVMECHQKNLAGNGLILHYLAQTFRFPKDFEMMCYTSQLLQAEAMRYGIEHWRRNRGRCMGTLYWQYNDCWPVCSWSSVDYFGRWKALQYFARRFYAPVHLSAREDGTKADIHVTNDSRVPVDAEVRWSLERLDGAVIRSETVQARVGDGQDVLLASLDFADDLKGEALRRTVLVHELLVDGKPSGVGLTPFVPSKHLELPDPAINIEVESGGDGRYLCVSAARTARFVCLSVPGKDVLFSQNYFDLPAGRRASVKIESDIDPADLVNVKAVPWKDSY